MSKTMETNKLYKHIRNTEVAFKPNDIKQETDGSLTVRGVWWNIVNLPTSMHTIEKDVISINKDAIQEWQEIQCPQRTQ